MAFIERPRYSCSLGGALDTINSISGAVAIIHASSGCGGNLFSAQQMGGSYGAGYCGGLAVPSSNVTENEIIFGGEERLAQQIEKTLEIIDAELFIVVSGCMTEIIGDDPKAVANRYSTPGKPVFAISTGGFKGNSYKGYDLVMKTLFSEFVQKSGQKKKNHVNVWGVVPSKDPFFRGDLEEIKRLLSLIGITANIFFGPEDTLESLKKSGEASANIVLSRVYGIEAAEAFKEIHGTPYILEDIPVGAVATEKFLLRIAEFLSIDAEIVNKAIEKEKKHYYYYIERVADIYLDSEFQHYSVVVGNSNYCAPVTKFLSEDIGWLPELSVITDGLTDEEKEAVTLSFEGIESVSPPKIIFETNASEIQAHFSDIYKPQGSSRYYNSPSPLFIFGSSLEKELAERLGGKILIVSFPVINRALMDKCYAGFKGGLHLFEDILSILLAGR